MNVYGVYPWQEEAEWEPGDRPVNSVVPPPRHATNKTSPFNRSEFEVFATQTMSAEHTGDAHGDRLPCWFENLNERERKGKRATAAAWRTRGGVANARQRRGNVANARRRRGERAAVSARMARSLYI